MKRLILIALLALPLTITAHNIGQTHFDWDHSGLDTNGLPTTLTGFVVQCGNAPGVYTYSYPITDGSARYVTISELGLPDGRWYCSTYAMNPIGASAPSNEVDFYLVGGQKVEPAVPAAPYGLTILDQ